MTWVLGLPTGHEHGQYLTVDLGGTNLRVCWITLQERKGETEIEQDKYSLPSDTKTGTADQLWSLVADALGDFIEKHNLGESDAEPLPLSFTFSYPASQDYIDHGVLQRWTKGFDIQGVEGEDVVMQLRDALDEKVSFPLLNLDVTAD